MTEFSDDQTERGGAPDELVQFPIESSESPPTVAGALRRERVVRLTTAARLACVAISVVAVSLFLSYRANSAAVVASALAILLALNYWWLAQRLASGRKVPAPLIPTLGVLSVGFILAVSVFSGVFSPAVVGLFVAVMYWGMSDRAAEAWVVYVSAAAGYLVMSCLAVFGVIDVRDSVMALGAVRTSQLVQSIVVIEVVLALVFKLTRDTRRASVEALSEVELAHRRIRQRDALLLEARADLERVVGANRMGRYSGLEIEDFRVAEVIGRGGGGDVYRATRRDTDEDVALKVLPLELVHDEDAMRRFFREIDVCRRLVSPNIARILGSGHAPDGAPYFAMELLDGTDLSALLRERQTLPLPEVIALVSQVSRALTLAHEAGVVHRDLKPQNLFRTETDGTPEWKVLDFGVSKVDGAGATLGPGVLVGTPSYMAPEQIACSADLDRRADVFALGVITYRALTGRPPFMGKTMTETIYNVQNVQPARPSELVALPPDVDLVLALCLAKEPDDRLPSAATFAAALADAARSNLATPLRHAARELLSQHPWWAAELTVRAPAKVAGRNSDRPSAAENG